MLNKTIRMQLLSDLCPASGDGFAGYVDTDVCFDDFGLPYIPAKRLKGVLRECALDILSVDNSYATIFNELFGETGKFVPGTLNMGNGKLENYAEIAQSIGAAERSELAEVFTSVRTRTKMEDGKAAKGTLRTARVLNKGQVYEFPVSFADDSLAFFEMCVKSLRHIGLNRSRGLGEVKCSLIDTTVYGGIKFENIGERNSFSFTLKLTEPVISAERLGKPQETENYIFGSAILGAFAVKYIERFGLKQEEAYKDADFRRIFLGEGVTFTAAMPSIDGEIYYPVPLALRTDKLGTRLYDETNGVCDDNNSDQLICKRLGGFIVADANGQIKTFTPNKIAFAHHARPANRTVAHATENDGKFYIYEALSEGQTFTASVIGNAEDIKIIADLFNDSDYLRLGRSRTAQYGNVKIIPAAGDFAANSLNLKNGDTFRLVAVTPIILEDANGINKADVSLVRDCFGAGFELVRSVCAETVVSGYYGKWLLPKRQERALAEGSTIVFRYTGAGTTLSLDFVGKRTGEGFGQIRLESVPEPTAFSFAEENKDVLQTKTDVLPEVEALRAGKEAVSEGIEYGEKVFLYAPQNANLSRVLEALSEAKGYTKFAELLAEIKQFEQKCAALAFATGKDKRYFKIDEKHLAPDHIAGLMGNIGYEYEVYQKYLNSAAQRIKQKRRNKSENTKGGERK